MKEAAMADDLPENDPRKIWQDQPKEPSTVTLKMIRMKVQDLRTKTRRNLWGSWAGPLAVGGLSAYGIKLVHGLFPVLEAAFVFAIVWSLAGVYFLNRGMRSAAMPGDAALSTGLEFYRREVERLRVLNDRLLLWSFGPIVLAIATFILFLVLVSRGKIGEILKGMPFFILIVIWMFGYFFLRTRERRELQREIDDLNDIEQESRR
jgi:uncharacterized membrane protein